MLSVMRYLAVCGLVCSIVGLWQCPLAAGQSPQVRASETREYEILVKGKLAGTMTTKIADTADGLTAVDTDASVAVNFIVYTYRYEFHGHEVWQGDRLLSVDARAVDGNTRLATHARCDVRGSVVDVPGKSPQSGPALELTTNYWRAPAAAKGAILQLFDADEGTIHVARIDDLAPEVVEAAGRKINCTHYRLGGDLAADLWFDDQHRLVCEQTTEDGYPTETRLTRITSGAPEIARH